MSKIPPHIDAGAHADKSGTDYRLLMVEDSPTDVFLFRMMLEDDDMGRSYELRDVSRLTDAFKLLAQEDFDLIILDLNLLDMNGTTSVEVLHAEAPDTPIIVYSGMDSLSLRRKALESGAARYLVKGVHSVTELKSMIDAALLGFVEEI